MKKKEYERVDGEGEEREKEELKEEAEAEPEDASGKKVKKNKFTDESKNLRMNDKKTRKREKKDE